MRVLEQKKKIASMNESFIELKYNSSEVTISQLAGAKDCVIKSKDRQFLSDLADILRVKGLLANFRIGKEIRTVNGMDASATMDLIMDNFDKIKVEDISESVKVMNESQESDYKKQIEFAKKYIEHLERSQSQQEDLRSELQKVEKQKSELKKILHDMDYYSNAGSMSGSDIRKYIKKIMNCMGLPTAYK